MGFSTDLILPGQEGHYSEFTCAVCFQLVDAPLLTVCQHIFCTSCLQDWFENKPSCPTCTQELDPRHGAGELKLASPLANRVLGRLRVKCSLPGCPWVGEYSEVSTHLTSSTSHQAIPAASASASQLPQAQSPTRQQQQPAQQQQAAPQQQQRASAEALKAAGNSKFEQRIYVDAIILYTKAINLASDVPTYYNNRAACYFCTARYSDCVADCQTAIRLDASLGKAYKRLGKAYCEMGEFERAKTWCEEGVARAGADSIELVRTELREISQLVAWQSEGLAAMAHSDFSLARTFFANMLAKTNSPSTRLNLVKAELALGLCDRALRTTRDVIKSDPNISEAYVLRGLALLFSADLDQAQKHLREALRLDPDDAEAGRAMKKARKLERHMDAAKQVHPALACTSSTLPSSPALLLPSSPLPPAALLV